MDVSSGNPVWCAEAAISRKKRPTNVGKKSVGLAQEATETSNVDDIDNLECVMTLRYDSASAKNRKAAIPLILLIVMEVVVGDGFEPSKA